MRDVRYREKNADRIDMGNDTVAYWLKVRTVELEKQPLLGNGCVTRKKVVTVGSGVFYAIPSEAI
jgi:hypothetical protein